MAAGILAVRWWGEGEGEVAERKFYVGIRKAKSSHGTRVRVVVRARCWLATRLGPLMLVMMMICTEEKTDAGMLGKSVSK
jgi:hypothetical protein